MRTSTQHFWRRRWPAFDTVTDFSAADDKFVLPTAVNHINDAVSGGRLAHAHFDADLEHALGPHLLHAGNAVLYTPDAGNYVGHEFLVVDANGTAGYQAGEDYVIDVTGMTGTLTANDFLVAV